LEGGLRPPGAHEFLVVSPDALTVDYALLPFLYKMDLPKLGTGNESIPSLRM